MNDILLNGLTGGLLIKNGDLVIGNSDTQNIHDLINDAPGEWKQNPSVGLNIISYLNSNLDNTSFKQQVTLQLQKDGFKTQNMVIDFSAVNSTQTIDVSGVTR